MVFYLSRAQFFLRSTFSLISVFIIVALYNTTANALSWSEGNPDEMENGESVTITIDGDCPPYTWKVRGEGFLIGASITEEEYNTLSSDVDTCGTAEIEVVDSCGGKITGYTRGDAGSWMLKNTYSCLPTMQECVYNATDSLVGPREVCDNISGNTKVTTINVSAVCKKNWERCQYVEGCIPPAGSVYPYNEEVYEVHLFTWFKYASNWECPEIDLVLPEHIDTETCT